jgi:YHS domain-containing protein
MRKWLVCALLLSAGLFVRGADEGDGDPKAALQAVQEFIGGWNGTANDIKNKGFWKEKANWSWRFKGKDVWMSFALEDSKLYKSGELRFIPAKSKYQLTIIDKADNKAVYEGELKKNMLVVERTVADTGTEQLKMNIAGGGDRLVYSMWLKPEGRTQFFKQLEVGYTKEGVTFGVEAGAKWPECVVTGGRGTSTVSYKGVTYYVCCSGCRDAFNENPAKIIAEYMARKKSK